MEMYGIEQLLHEAINNKSSDLHITVGVPPILRVHGSLKYLNYPKLVPTETERLLKELMTKQQLDHFNHHGEVDFSYSLVNMGRFRINVFSQRGSMAAAIRVVASEIPDPRDLGLPKSVIQLHNNKRGLILVTGPTGSGKSTTLASLIDQINQNRSAHIVTLEDPIEYLHRHNRSIVNQREIGLDTNSYASALRAALRQDPDVILVGEMRDLETISIAITAAETGHLVLSTLHTVGAAKTIDRIIDVFPPYQQQQIRVQLSTVLTSVISQQLLPKKDGAGRVAAFEIMHINPAIRNLIREAKTHQIPSIIQTNKAYGMQTMDDALYDLYRDGIITKEKALTFATEAKAIERKVL